MNGPHRANPLPTAVLLMLAAVASVSRPAAAATPPPIDIPYRPPVVHTTETFAWRLDEPHGFLLAGISLLSVDFRSASGWTVSGGAELPMGTFSLVPRAGFAFGSSSSNQTLLLGSATINGRLSFQRGGLVPYTEAGLGLAVQEGPRASSLESGSGDGDETKLAPVFRVVGGTRSDPNQGHAFLVEAGLSITSARPSCVAFEGAAGIEF